MVEKKKFDMAPARPDGRPMFYTLPAGGDRVQCALCAKAGLLMEHKPANACFNDPANAHDESALVYTYCRFHTPENAVFFDRATGLTSDKKGNVWKDDYGKR